MASDPNYRINLSALQQNDPYIGEIELTAGQVALYNFNAEANEWEKTEVQGTMFVYSRSASPQYGFTIMNRLSMQNLTEPINKHLEFQRKDPFLLYKTAQSIHGIWFYNKEQCGKVAITLGRLVQKVKVKEHHGGAKHRTKSLGDISMHTDPSGQGSIDIMQMLSKAQLEYNQSQSEPKSMTRPNPQVVRPVPVRYDSPLKVQPSAGSQLTMGQVRGQQETQLQRSISVQKEVSLETKTGSVPPLLQRLFSQPGDPSEVVQPSSDAIKTVESLERLNIREDKEDEQKAENKPKVNVLEMLTTAAEQHQQEQQKQLLRSEPLNPRSIPTITPQSLKQFPTPTKAVCDLHHSHSDSHLISPEPPHRIASKGLTQSLTYPLSVSSSFSVGVPTSPRVPPSSSSSYPDSQDIGGSGDAGFPPSTRMRVPSGDIVDVSDETSLLPTSPQRIPASVAPPTLLTPSLLTQGQAASSVPSSLFLVPSAVSALPDVRPTSAEDANKTITPLTKEQFKAAYMHLLQTDDDFVSKLHSAYVQQLQPKS